MMRFVVAMSKAWASISQTKKPNRCLQNIPVAEYTPIQIKQAITGTGRADKNQVTFMVQKLLNIKEKPKPDDVADALAIAICGLHSEIRVTRGLALRR